MTRTSGICPTSQSRRRKSRAVVQERPGKNERTREYDRGKAETRRGRGGRSPAQGSVAGPDRGPSRGVPRMGSSYHHPALKQLKEQQARFAPRERRLEQIDRAEQLLGEIEAQQALSLRVPLLPDHGVPPGGGPALVLEGGDVRHDLRLFVEDLSATVGQPVEQAAEPVLTVDAVSRRFNVSPRTVTRWRRQGLVARRFVIDGRTKVGFLESSLSRFVEAHRDQVDRGTRFRQLTDAERDEIIRRARRMALVSQAGLVEIARRIARKMSRSTETVRSTLKAYDRDHPDRAIFPPATGPLDEEAKGADLPALPPGGLGRGPGRASSAGPGRASTASSTRCGPGGSSAPSSSSCPTRASTTPPPAPRSCGPMPEPADGKAPRRTKAPKGLPPYLADLYEVPLLSREQEVHLFRKMNYLKSLANQLRDQVDPAGRGPPTSTRSSGSRRRRWRSRTRSSAPTSGWSSRSPSGTSAPRTTSSSWSPTATCR